MSSLQAKKIERAISDIPPSFYGQFVHLGFRAETQMPETAFRVMAALHAEYEGRGEGLARFLDWISSDQSVFEKAGGADGARETWERLDPFSNSDDPVERVLSLAESARSLGSDSKKRKQRPQLFAPSAARWAGCKPEPRRFAIDKLVPLGSVTLLISAGGRGKSQLAMQMMTCVASGRPFLGYAVEAGRAAGMFCEDDDNELHHRQRDICEALGVRFSSVAAYLSPTSYVDDNLVLWEPEKGATKDLGELVTFLRKMNGDPYEVAQTLILQGKETQEGVGDDYPLKLLVIDGSAFVFAGNESDRGQVTRFLKLLNGIAHSYRLAIVLITHESKTSADNDTHAASGTTAWLNAARSALKLDMDPKDPGKRVLKHIKTNRSKGGVERPIVCRAANGVFENIGADPKREADCFNTVQRLVTEAIESGVKLSPAKQARNYIVRYVHRSQDGKGFAETELERAVALLQEFHICLRQYESKGRLCQHFVLQMRP